MDKITKTEQIIDWLRNYAQKRINSRLIDERRCIAPYIVLDFGNQGLLGMIAPRSYGGLELKYQEMLKISEQVAAIDLNLALFVVLSNVLGIYPILKHGNESQKEKYLTSLSQGRELAAFALTEPSAGSNPRRIKTKAIPNGKGGWLISGTKIWSGSASWSSVMNVFAEVFDEQGKSLKITAFTISQNTKGLTQGTEAMTMGMRGMVQNTIHFDQVPVNQEHILGEIGLGFNVAQDAMQLGRLGIAAMCLGGMKRCTQLMLRYANGRSLDTVGKLLDKQITLNRLSDLTAAITAVECLMTTMATWLDEGKTVPQEAYLAIKIIAPEFMWQAADNLVQLLGGRGYIESNIAPQILRDARVMRIFEGPTETLPNHLGLMTLYHVSKICSSLNQLLEALEISTKLQETAKSCLAYVNTKELSQNEKKMLCELLSQKLGEIAAWAFMLACLQKSHRTQPIEKIKDSEKWVTEHFEKKLNNLKEEISNKPILFNADKIKTQIKEYSNQIGDLEQTLASEEYQLDEYLCKDGFKDQRI